MAIRLAGIAIDNNFDKDLNQLSDALEWTIEKIEEDTFETAFSIFFSEDEDAFYVLFTEHGTLVFTPLEVARYGFSLTNSKYLRFAYETTSMTFLFNYCDEQQKFREFWESEGNKNSEMGEPLALEEEYSNASGLILRFVKDLVGVSFDYIDPQEVVYKCTKRPYKNSKLKDLKSNNNKRWWEFWK